MSDLPPISGDIVGVTAGPHVQEIDARWLMAYAAALGEFAPEYLDTARPDGIVGHPLFPVAYEWPLAVELRAKAVPDAVALRSVHATHDLEIHRRVRPGDQLTTTATVTVAEARVPGAYVVMRLDTVDGRGNPVSTTRYGSLYLGVECDRPSARPDPAPPRPDPDADSWETAVPIAATLAHVYTECARIWNPVHTDAAVAREVGLPRIILHGTATLALAVSAVLAREPAGPASPVSRITGRFGGMVFMPSTLRVRGTGRATTPGGRSIAFEAISAEGRPAVRDGRLLLAGRGTGRP
ncbi:MAG: MaoC family dehydratase N-terminal domain-containing protein [Candidatus Rokubacteria bacterium]|nr:MaoC family dehydratase N-terminal domain-containing protein [Candidatus Rokubacteria bacterium]